MVSYTKVLRAILPVILLGLFRTEVTSVIYRYIILYSIFYIFPDRNEIVSISIKIEKISFLSEINRACRTKPCYASFNRCHTSQHYLSHHISDTPLIGSNQQISWAEAPVGATWNALPATGIPATGTYITCLSNTTIQT